ncbi:MAG TPA: MarR family transcriptional regulator [bacterium]|nr:MarR family transcriptional regulator [bacterium]
MNRYEEKLADLAPRIMGAFHSVGKRHAEHEQLTMRQFQALVIVNTSENLSISAFCEKLGLAASTGTELANRMIASGYFAKQSESPDKRQVYLKVTPHGLQALELRKRDMIDLFARLIEPMSAEERQTFAEAFDTIWKIISRYY